MEIKHNHKLILEIRKRLKNFRKPKSNKGLFNELVFCILVANTNLEKTYFIWEKLKNKFYKLSLKELRKKLKKSGYRFYNKRAEYIYEAKCKIKELNKILKLKDEKYIRDWLAKNIKGLGYKEASHFLRNLGYKNFAILDRHILRFLYKNKIIKEIPKTLTRKKYIEIEEKLRKIANKNKLNLAELDFLIFYIQTSKFPIK